MDRQARQLRHDSSHNVPMEQLNLEQLRRRLVQVEYEHQQLKELIWDLRTDLSALIVTKPKYRNTVSIPNFAKSD